MTELTDFELPNAAAGPDPLRLREYASDPDRDAIVLLFQRDYHCPKCREQVQTVASRYDEFVDRRTAVISILPESIEQATRWNDQYDLPFPLLADESKTTSDQYDQPTRFGALGSLHDMVGRMPEAVLIDATGQEPTIEYVHRGKLPADRPTVDDLLERIDALVSARV
ncbi:peroxiredoxin family protein [Natronorubrum aibiense]|uniref:Redoxin domain-containing protein n=1 Tax=Natronorubrum aibiense TaxID=348826 RepID=A0A5P9P9E1_9EURY|nr:redoxin domain-containing protein [Natronorubrum aibiense]QFU84728.1 redoxin domain-containing protein [Natronorubrum aibiense]